MSEELELHEGIQPIEREWDELADRVDASPFLRPGWISAWWNAFGEGELALIALRRDGERLAGLIPLQSRRGLLASTTNWHTPVYGPVAEDPSASAALAKEALDRTPRRLRLSFLDQDFTDLEGFRTAASRAGYRVAERVMLRSPYVAATCDWETYWKSRTGNQRRGVNRLRRRLEDQGEVRLEVADGSENLDHILEEAFAVEASGWKGGEGTAIVSRPETRRFYSDVARWAAGRGMLRIACLRVNGRAVAIHLSLEAQGRYYLLKPGFDPEFSKMGPGKLLDREMVAWVFSKGLKSFEFLGKDDPYKLTWADHSHDRIDFQAFSRSPAGVVDRVVQTRGRALARRIIALRR